MARATSPATPRSCQATAALWPWADANALVERSAIRIRQTRCERSGAIKNPVGVGETYRVRREETLRTSDTCIFSRRFIASTGFAYSCRPAGQSAVRIFFTFGVIARHFADGVLLTVTKSPSSKTLATPDTAKSCDTSGWSCEPSACKKLTGRSAITRSSTNFIAFGFGVGWTSNTLNPMQHR